MAPPVVLLVDDQPEMRRALRRLLQEEGYALQEATTGAEALALVRAVPPALVAMDDTMPVLRGEDALVRMRAEGFRGPVLMLSAHLDEAMEVRLSQLGATRCLWKLDLGRLFVPTVAELLGRSA